MLTSTIPGRTDSHTYSHERLPAARSSGALTMPQHISNARRLAGTALAHLIGTNAAARTIGVDPRSVTSWLADDTDSDHDEQAWQAAQALAQERMLTGLAKGEARASRHGPPRRVSRPGMSDTASSSPDERRAALPSRRLTSPRPPRRGARPSMPFPLRMRGSGIGSRLSRSWRVARPKVTTPVVSRWILLPSTR